jgi:Arc/MetJ-type ribon-helix-helix transcriptional regulator
MARLAPQRSYGSGRLKPPRRTRTGPATGRSRSWRRAPVSGGLGPIPIWYHIGMSKQIAVRLPDQLVEFIDERVQEGSAPSRAAVVAEALERERRRALAERDAAILAQVDEHDEMDDLAAYAGQVRLDDLE